jgi:hypothetical protein
MNMAVFRVVAPCRQAEVYQHFGIALVVEAALISETLNFYQTSQRYNPEDSHLSDRPIFTSNQNSK